MVEYVLNNPVRAGIVKEWSEYAYSGSLAFGFRSPVAEEQAES
jgi:hypothetical protein